MKSIDIFCVLGPQSLPYAKFLKQSLVLLASGEYKLNFKSIRTNSRENAEGWTEVAFMKPFKHPSLTHGSAMNEIHKYTDADYTVMADVDTAIVCKDWDQELVSHIKDNIALVGTEAISRWAYRDFPAMYLVLFDTDILTKVQPDFRPYLENKKHSKRGRGCIAVDIPPEDRQYFRCKRMLTDTAWELPKFIKQAGYEGCCIPCRHEKWIRNQKQVWGFSTPMVCHLEYSSKREETERCDLWMQGIVRYVYKKYQMKLRIP